MRNFCLFVALILLVYPTGRADALQYFGEDAEYEFCTYETPSEQADAVYNGLFWEVRADSSNRLEVFDGLKDVKAVTVTVREFDRETFFRDFKVTVLSVQTLPDLTIYYCLSGTLAAADTGNMQIAVRSGVTKIGIPALLNSY